MRKLIFLLVFSVVFLSACTDQKTKTRISSNDTSQVLDESKTKVDKSGSNSTSAPSDSSSETSKDKEEPEESNSQEDLPSPSADESESHNSPVSSDSADGVIEIKERLFIQHTNDIYINSADYMGKTIKYEGIFDYLTWEETGETYYYVIRYGPGCCAFDANAGFEVIWDGEWPEQNDWVEVIGKLESYEDDGINYLRLNLSSITVLDVRGSEYVN